MRGAFYGVFASGITLIFGILDIINLAHGATFMWGAVLGWLLMSELGFTLGPALLAVAGIGGVLGVLTYQVAIKPIYFRRDAEYLGPLLSTIALSILGVNLAETYVGTSILRYPPESTTFGTFEVSGVTISSAQLWLMAVAAAFMVALWYLVDRTALGRNLKAIEENREVAAMLGLNVGRLISTMFFIAGALAGCAGLLLGVAFDAASPYMGIPLDFKGFAVVVLGGMGSVKGAFLAGFLVAGVEVLTVILLSSEFQDLVSYAMLILTLAFMPNGLFGKSREQRA